MDGIYNFLADAHALYTAGLRNFVADGVNHHTGMIVGILHHCGCIDLKVLHKISVIRGIGGLHTIPIVKRLIHHIKTHFIASFHQTAAHRVVGAADCVEPGLFDIAGAVQFGGIIVDNADNAHIIMDAATAQKRRFPIDKQSTRGVNFNYTQTKRFRDRVNCFSSAVQGDFGKIQIRMFGVPELCVRNFQFDHSMAVCNSRLGANHFLPVFLGDSHLGTVTAVGHYLYPHASGCDRQRCDTHAISFHIGVLTHQQMHRAVNTAARVPTIMTVLRHMGGDFNGIVAFAQKSIQFHRKWRVPVSFFGGGAVIHCHRRHAVYTLKFQYKVLIYKFRRDVQILCIGIIVAAPACQQKPCKPRLGIARGVEHGVMRQGHIKIAAIGAAEMPAGVKIQSLHCQFTFT